MTLLSIVLVLVVVGFLTWLVITFVPMPAPFPSVVCGVVGIFMLFWLLQQFGVISGHLHLH